MFPFSLRRHGILGINARNLDYLFPNNPRRLYRYADCKLETKKLAQSIGVPVPETYGVITFQHEVKKLSNIVGEHKSFVIKPAQGSGGDGIVVISDVTEKGYRKASGSILEAGDLQYHIYNILSGMFSLGGQSDRAIVEYTVQFDPIFDEIAYQGVPDIRVIVYRGVPAMGMLRLPTRASDGKANLHRGGVGVGIDLATGTTLAGIQKDRYIDNHPETGHSLRDRKIPHWQTILEMAAKLGDKTEFGYLGVDIVLDREKGPLLLEINARPGLAIQIANREGLIGRLETIDCALPKLSGIPEKIKFAQETFAVETSLFRKITVLNDKAKTLTK
ncbi:alpha-L-glutamate ligase-like protein [Coleofasciculus sp. FACHB-1120]|uniref:alpha-L-glutamate ligase-like protein n=1 Tax=Coleofasciculus sp. FACHB-1120 TaxID=2692783 RepID=UPI0016860E00|nr:alpha-L-glutamate ligase-like protein [Coleofasciculus sp. FACHB-1120]MBD2742758.1 alpha-L-glutamate ligase-like protein [Coleofasciculus sp. FACHB-1120]